MQEQKTPALPDILLEYQECADALSEAEWDHTAYALITVRHVKYIGIYYCWL